MKELIDITVAILALTTPVWTVYLVLMFIRWQEYRSEREKKLNQCTMCMAWVLEGTGHFCSHVGSSTNY